MSQEPTASRGAGERPRFDEAQVRYALDQVRAEQSVPKAVVAGALAAAVGAGVWALITVLTSFQIGWMAVGVGFLVGLAVRTFGKGTDTTFGVIGALLALAGCLLGNLLTVCGMIAADQSLRLVDVVTSLDLRTAYELMFATFSPMDLLFYGIAVYEGYRLSVREVTEEELATRITGAPPIGR